MKLKTSPRISDNDPLLQRELREHANQVNQLAEGRIVANYAAMSAIPTTGTYYQGDLVRNSLPVELGAAASKYVVYGWICTAGGTPGAFVDCRFLTGN